VPSATRKLLLAVENETLVLQHLINTMVMKRNSRRNLHDEVMMLWGYAVL
jgi:spore cortex formation protein SpoVR/YcgB (stage V sporulation)